MILQVMIYIILGK